MAKKLALIFGLLILTVLGFALVYRSYPTVIPSGPALKRSTPAAVNITAPSPITIVLSEQNDSGESGTSTISEADGKITIRVDLSGAPADVTQPAHIHLGSCADLGAVKYPLVFSVDGASTTTLEVSLSQLLSALPLAINVHKSGSEAGVYVSCGDIP